MKKLVVLLAVGVGMAVLPAVALPAAVPAHAAATWTWPVTGPVIRDFDPPDQPFGSGHRGIDIAAAVGTTVLAATGGSVTFAGPVGGRLFLTIDHGGGLESTYSFLESLLVRRGDVVAQGAPIARSGIGHAGALVPHLHFGVRLNDEYQDPLDHLGAIDVWRFIRLAPLALP
ncbi:MAG TPA: M23 family metallopeptidase [Actinomycetota bacterium]|nr:M23 family metallopeptidase [Actinomycetota bacterium]